MKRDAADILKEVLALPAEARATLAGQLLDSSVHSQNYDVGSSWKRDAAPSNDFAPA